MKALCTRLAAAAALAVLSACAAPPLHASLTFETAPPGATLYEGGQSLGIGPVTRSYPAVDKGTPITTPEITAVWPSGAKTTFWTNLQAGDDRVATITRPAGAAGLDVDLANAKKYQDADARAKAAQQRDLHRNSARCAAQQQGGVVAGVDDCS